MNNDEELLLRVWDEDANESGVFVLKDELIEDEIRKLAYLKWEAKGCPSGQGAEFWHEAEQEINVILGLSPPPPTKSDYSYKEEEMPFVIGLRSPHKHMINLE